MSAITTREEEAKEKEKWKAREKRNKEFIQNYREIDSTFTKAVDKMCKTPGCRDDKQVKIVSALLHDKEELIGNRYRYLNLMVADDQLYESEGRRCATVGYDKLRAIVSLTLGSD